MKSFEMKDLGEVKRCLGMNITRDRTKGILWIDQKDYTQKKLEKFNMQNSRPVTTPADPNTKLDQLSLLKMKEKKVEKLMNIPYQEAVGSLIYLSVISRPDISCATNSVSR